MAPRSSLTMAGLQPVDAEEIAEGWCQELEGLRERWCGMAGRTGWGDTPALVIVDMQRGFSDPTCPLGGSHDQAVESSARLVAAARAAGMPIVLTAVRYRCDLSDAGNWSRKLSAQYFLVEGTDSVQLDGHLGCQPGERILTKRQASAFSGTFLHSQLTDVGVDAAVFCGCTTSGCVRATTVDARSLGYYVILVRDAVGDRHRLVHKVSLFDIDAKYGDVVDEASAIAVIGCSSSGREMRVP